MKILHTSDWHIGKKLMGRERYDEYRAVLDEISDICRREQVDLALVAGDVFDTYTPSAEAEEIFYTGIKKIAETCAALVISGNHDDGQRLTAAATMASELNVYIVSNNAQKIFCRNSDFKVKPILAEEGYAVFENGKGEKVYVNILPYPNEARFKEGKSEEGFSDKVSRWINFGERGKSGKIPSVFLSHVFVAGGASGESEREIELGGTRLVEYDLLPKCDYCALGHLHKRQNIANNVFYCGAPMRFSFDEAGSQKSVNVFDLSENGINDFKRFTIKNAKELVRLQACGVKEGVSLLKQNPDCFVELTLNLSEPITISESILLKECENLISLKAEVSNPVVTAQKVSNKNKSASQLFTEFYESKFDCKPCAELLELFLSMTEVE